MLIYGFLSGLISKRMTYQFNITNFAMKIFDVPMDNLRTLAGALQAIEVQHPRCRRFPVTWRYHEVTLYPGNLTWIPKIMASKMYVLSNMDILGIYVKFQGGKPVFGFQVSF